MEVTLEKIELVKDRTGVTYKEAKEALEAADGNVVDAIVSIEDKTDGESSQKISEKGNEIVDKIKEVIDRGNASRIIISKDGDKLLNLPLNAGVIGAIVAPWGVILGVAASFGFNCKIEVVKEDGTVVDITDKAGNLYEQAVTKTTEYYEQAMSKGNEVVETVKEKAPGVVDTVKEKGEEAMNMAKDAADKITGKKEEAQEVVSEAVDEAAEKVADAADDAVETVEDVAESAADAVDEAADEVKDEE